MTPREEALALAEQMDGIRKRALTPWPILADAAALLRQWPEQTTRKPLTDSEIDELMPYVDNEYDLADYRQFARAIEAAHGIAGGDES